MATAKSLAAIELVRRGYTKLSEMTGSPERDALIEATNAAYTTTMLLRKDPEMELQPHQQKSLDDLRKALGDDGG